MTNNYDYIIEFIDVHKSFNSNYVLKGINLGIKKGENLCILGGSGSGKTVILKELCGLIKVDKGKILIEGELKELQRWCYRKFGDIYQSIIQRCFISSGITLA